MFRTGLILLIFYILIQSCNAQDRPFAQSTIDTLCSPSFYGRGYVNNGDQKAADYIAGQYQAMGLKPLGSQGYLYPFRFFVNTFPGKCRVKAGGKKLIPGVDFIVDPGCPSVRGRFMIRNSTDTSGKISRSVHYGWLFDTSGKKSKKSVDPLRKKDLRIDLSTHLTWSVSTRTSLNPGIEVLYSAFPSAATHVRVNIRSQMMDHTAFNVIGYIPGREIRDSFLVITAHYDHLGMMGKTIFPGANDNASGVAMMLDLAAYFSKNPPRYSVAFIAFAGEEAGLIGSKAYTDKPLEQMPLGRIRFLVNLDLMGSGEKGMAVVNATVFPTYFNKLQSINSEKKYLTGFKSRGKAANSDHYWFSERGVKSFFFYLMGDYHWYHDIRDNREALRLGPFYDKSFALIRDFLISF